VTLLTDLSSMSLKSALSVEAIQDISTPYKPISSLIHFVKQFRFPKWISA